MQSRIVGWNYYEDGEFCRFFSVHESATMQRLVAHSGGTCVPIFSEKNPDASRGGFTTETPLIRY
jgi:hypothetical protein